jgi:hypothetical protein
MSRAIAVLRWQLSWVYRKAGGVSGVAAGSNLADILAHASMCISAVDAATDQLVGAMAFFISTPPAHLMHTHSADLAAWLASQAKSRGLTLPAGMIVPWLVLHPDHEHDAFLAITRFAIELCPTVERFAICVEAPLPLCQPYLASYCGATAVAHGPEGAALHIAPRKVALPPVNIRKASVGDSDEIAPLLERAQSAFGSLAQVRSHIRLRRQLASSLSLFNVVSPGHTPRCSGQ